MAAAGGGKIRTRRYHIASKPYAKGNQQSGLISRVTDTVKSIVPSWLQRYFRNGEAAEGGGVVPNSPTPPPNDGEAGGPLPDGRDSPEPSTSNAEPSTSRVALNFHDALSRPPLSRSHLNFGSLDGSPTFTQPSTSSAHLSGGPSSFSLVKEIKDTASQHEDDNISTTSGFSSRASDKDVTTTKVALLPVLWSPENERTHSGPPQAQSALKKPAFNLSVFGTSSSSLNSTTLNSSQLGDSPFYPGKTTYGGAAAVRTSARGRPGTPYQAPVRRQVKAKPAGAQPCGVTSATARRILLSLERMSSPLADAKRIPSTVSSPLSTSLDRADLDVSHIQLKRRKVDSPLPPVQKLLVPAASSVAGNRSMSFRPSLTPSGSLSRAMASRSNRDTLAGQLTIESNDASLAHPRSTSSFAYPLSSTPTANSMGSRGAGGKMKRERSVRPSSKRPDEESADVPELPAVSLPINTFTLPSFSFSSPPLTSSITPTTLANKVPAAASSPPCTPFTFSSPIVKATVSSTSSFSPSSGFTFSAPVAKAGLSEFNGKVETHLVTPVKPPSTTTASAPVSGEEFEGPFKPAKVLKQGSVLDLLKGPGFSSSPPTARSSPCLDKPLQALPSIHGGSAGFGDKFKPLPGSWNCGVCMLQNGPADGKCIACQTMRPTLDSSQSKPDALQTAQQGAPTGSGGGFGSLFTRPAGSWDCDTCLVQNKPEVVKCVACETAKPGTGVKPGLTLPPFSEPQTLPTPSSSNTAAVTTTTTTTQPSGFLGFGNLFKKPEGSWDCDTCMVENKAADTKCVSCQSPKPGAATPAPPSSASSTPVPSGGTLVGFGDKFKQPEGSWDCGVCLVQNTSEALQCVACQSNKPGVSAPPKGFGSSSSSSSSSSSTSFTFGTQSTSSSTNSTATPSLGGFKFGSSSTDTASSDASSSSFKFSAPSGGFKFGTSSSPAAQSEDGKKDETQCVSGGFKFSVGGGIVFGISGVGSGPSNGESKVPTEGFSVGPPKPEENNSTAPMPAPTGFTFSVPKGKPEEAPAAQTTPAAPFSFGKPQETKSATEPPPPQGATDKDQGSSGQALAPTSAFMFGKSEEKQESAAPSSGFLFKPKEAEKLASSVGFSFSKPDPPKDQPKPAFTFGKPAEKPDSTEPPKPSFSFSATATDAGASKPTFGFMVGPTTTTTASSSSTSSTAPVPTLFGASSGSAAPPPAPAPAPSGTFLFRQGTPAEAAPTFVFGQQSDNQPFLFGAAANPAVPSFAFGATATPTVCTAASGPSPAPFVFSPAPSSSVAPAFGVGQAPAFGQGSGQPGAPAFGSSVPSLFSATASQPPAFGSQPSATPAPVFGQQANATPSFSSTAQGGSFQFGGAGAFGASGASGAAVFFGSTTGASATSTAPPSVPAQPSGSGGGFNFSQPPTFNIGSTKSSFMAPVPGQHSISGRKIKTAVRRRK